MLRRLLWNNRPSCSAIMRVQRMSSASSGGPNADILDMLRRHMEEETELKASPFKIKAFSNAMDAISKTGTPITSGKEASKLKGVGKGIAERIDKFLSGTEDNHATDTAEAKKARQEEYIRRLARSTLETVPGLGPVTARKLVNQGCMSLAQLRDPNLPFYDQLKASQKIGVRFLEHLEQPVQRAEAEDVAQFVRENISSKFRVVLAGSYRRGARTSGDIDIILLHPDHVHVPTPSVSPPSTTSDALEQLSSKKSTGRRQPTFKTSSPASELSASLLVQQVVPTLTDRGLISASLTSGARKWQGIIRVPERSDVPEGARIGNGGLHAQEVRRNAVAKTEGRYRRMDLNLVPMKSYGAALLALTGDAAFNRDLRLRAAKAGMHLNEFGLWRWTANPTTVSSTPELSTSETSTLEPEKKSSSRSSKSTTPKSQSKNSINGGGFWELLKASSEADILEEVGMDYIEPAKRNFSFLLEKTKPARTSRKKIE